ncbi:glycosyl transferase [Fibrobacter sp. UWB2]|uniref:ATP-grasp fold amidoligase family protein n=1 Tax=Fibrobacter sp. UWB2 TaxID=1964358 RepID=UPI000B520511|nr:ATP-grasp fold amidoligase family protein [Fibrobacter sp. UWB2]OWV21556.1 glycosyl transferase [Fibrobacter sp. UWB2]
MFFKILLYKYLLQWIPDSLWIRIQFRRKVGRWPNLKNPKTFNEKLQWLKLHDRNPLYTKLVDKYEVKSIVAKQIGEEYIIPTLGVWDKFDDIDFGKLPNQFVLKCTHDSGGLIVVKDKSTLDIAAARKKINACLKMNYYWTLREWPYKNVKPRIIAEKYMEDESGYELKDYKIFCFNGEPKALFIATDRGIHETKFDFFDVDLNHLPMKQHYPNNPDIKIPDPAGIKKMFELAHVLTKDFKHCRADFYDINGKIYFGELTFSHFSGMQPMEPAEWDERFGSWLDLKN